jgi:predicted ArsR family transcriptional regulator
MPRPDDRFWESTRGQILVLMRRGIETVNELASALELTDNAVRSHLVALERDGLVRPSGTRRGPRKPAVTYELSPEAEQLFPKEYGPILRTLLDTLADRLPAAQFEEVARDAGHRFAKNFRPVEPTASSEDRAESAADVLRALGGCCEPTAMNGTVTLGCSACPLAVAAEGHPEMCLMVGTLLSDVIGIPVRHCCQTNPLRCRFEFDRGPAASG